LVRITDEGQYPFLAVHLPDEFAAGELYVGVAHKRTVLDSQQPAAHIVDIRRNFRGIAWTTFDLDDFSSGGPLADNQGRLIGVHIGRSNFGGFFYTQLKDVVPHLERMKKGEVWGNWYPGTGPMMGIEITTTNEGCKVTDVFPNTPAATAGIRKGDVVTHVEDRAVVSLDDVYRQLSDNDPGQEIAIKLLRQQQQLEAKIVLQPRTP
jgi:hypothetical protein